MIEPTAIMTYIAEENPFEQVDYLSQAKERETEQFKNKDVFNRYLTLLLQDAEDIQEAIKEVLQKRNLDNATGAQLDVIGRLLGQPRVLFDSAIIRYFGFKGATGASPYKSVSDTERVYGPWKSINDSLLGIRELTDDEYRRLLRLTIIKNTSDASITAFSDGVRLLFGLDNIDYQEDYPANYTEGSASITISIGRNYNDPEKSVFPGLDEITLAQRFLNRPLGVSVFYINPITFFADFQLQSYQQFVYGTDELDFVTFSEMFNFSRPYEADYYDSNGNLQTASVNQPRFGYDQTTLDPKGILINGPNEVLTHTWGLEVNDRQGTVRINLSHDNASQKEMVMLLEGVSFKMILFRENTYWKVRVEWDSSQSYEMIIPQVISDEIIVSLSYTTSEVFFTIEDEQRRAAINVPFGGANVRNFDVRIGGSFSASNGDTYNHFNGSVKSLMYLRPYIGASEGGGVLVESGTSITTEDYEKILTEFGKTITT